MTSAATIYGRYETFAGVGLHIQFFEAGSYKVAEEINSRDLVTQVSEAIEARRFGRGDRITDPNIDFKIDAAKEQGLIPEHLLKRL